MSIDFDRLKERAGELAQAGVAKARELTDAGVARAKQLTEIGKLKMQNTTQRDAIRKAYVELGKLYYAERGMAPEPAYAHLCEKITAAKVNIEENKARIAQIKQEGDISDAEAAAAETEAPVEEPAAGDDETQE